MGGGRGFSGRVRFTEKQHGGTPRNNKAQNDQTDSLAKKYNLTKDQQSRLHNEVTKQGYKYYEIEQIIKDMFNK
jgi:hypothetical protein